ncbi:MAG: PD-(D/E)XK nuclease family protein [Bacteroidaceae bacterium]|nr:PD-(D/E)XK nuclease family protein [Bacteroidaceae bacterium]
MEHFLKLVAEDLFSNYLDPKRGLAGITLIFPNQRAARFFDDHLTSLASKPVWSPAYMTIGNLFQQHSTLKTADQLMLVSTLYRVYKEVLHTDESLDSFWSWGEIMLADFDDLDRQMAPAEELFSSLDQQRQIDSDHSFLTEEQVNALKEFFRDFDESRPSELRTRYLNIWNSLGTIYNQLRSTIESQGLAYEGMLQRQVAEHIESIDWGNNMYAFIGFNSLNKAEHTLFKALAEAGKAIFYWDYDIRYVNDAGHEAGLFMRRNLKDFPNRISEDHFDNLSKEKELTIVESSTDNSQARYITKWLGELGRPSDRDTAIVLCNEALLQPVLHSVSKDDAKDINITMGYPLRSTPVHALTDALINLQRLGRRSNGKYAIEYVASVLANPLVQKLTENAAPTYATLLKERKFFPTSQDLSKDAALETLFRSIDDAGGILEYLKSALRMFVPVITDSQDTLFEPLNLEALYRTYTQINRLSSLAAQGVLDLNDSVNQDGTRNSGHETTFRLLRKVLAGASVPFHGEPVIGMQIMGLLETRNLDFNEVLLLSANEGTLPVKGAQASFIPYNLRAAFGLTTMKERSAISAYNFQHLIQRASKVTMVYNSNADAATGGTGMMSRYLLQMMVDGRTPVRRIRLLAEHATGSEQPITIQKTPEIINRLKQMYDSNLTERYLSPSALNTYFDCRLKFYFKYYAKINVRRDPTGAIESDMFGSIFHKSAELAYNDMAAAASNRLLTKEILMALANDKEAICRYVDQAFKEEYFNNTDVPTADYNGDQTINHHVIESYLKKLLLADAKDAPFTYISSESQDYEHCILVKSGVDDSDVSVRIQGKVDRIDMKDGIVRIVDYKTGAARKEVKDSLDILFDRNQAKRDSHKFQALYYATLLSESENYRNARLGAQLIYIRKPHKESYITLGGYEVNNFTVELKEGFTERLQALIQEIFSTETPFDQTKDRQNKCKYCDYAPLCSR